ncbi:MAG: hypothetical protein KDN22_25010 [Verrucomicrobiae bacterium]|nr:hypothetical protein [Verrucomicrobiae bacterium]
MKYRLTTILLAVGLLTLTAVPLQAQVRTWTSAADPSRKFQADYVKCENDVVTVQLKSGSPLSFPLSTLSAADQAFVRERLGKTTTTPNNSPAPGATAKAAVNLPALFKEKLVTVDASGKVKLFAYADGKLPKYFLLYVSAYW